MSDTTRLHSLLETAEDDLKRILGHTCDHTGEAHATVYVHGTSALDMVQRAMGWLNGNKMPRQKRGRSKQNYGTPRNFLTAVETRLGISGFDIDFAAESANYIAPFYLTKEQDALAQPWATLLKQVEASDQVPAWGWLNPPFDRIAPWVEKAWRESLLGAHVAVLIPASSGSNYWRDFVEDKALVLNLYGRLTFVGCTDPYPKDCVLLLYGPGIEPGVRGWSWKD